jgi:glycosyltransferase involved in cell wall biosynthesis
MAAQIKPRKRPLDAIEIIRILVEQKVDVHLTICGNGWEKMCPFLEQPILEKPFPNGTQLKRLL